MTDRVVAHCLPVVGMITRVCSLHWVCSGLEGSNLRRTAQGGSSFSSLNVDKNTPHEQRAGPQENCLLWQRCRR